MWKIIKSRVSVQTKDAFKAKALESGYTEASLQRLLIEGFLKQNPIETKIPAATEKKDDFIWLALNARMKAELRQRAAAERMSLSSYVVSLLRAHLSQKANFTESELEVLRQSNNELTAIGRNINQIARALNTSLDNSHLVKVAEIKEVLNVVRVHQVHVRDLISANLFGWGVQDER